MRGGKRDPRAEGNTEVPLCDGANGCRKVGEQEDDRAKNAALLVRESAAANENPWGIGTSVSRVEAPRMSAVNPHCPCPSSTSP